MTFMEAVKSGLNKYADFNGRATLSEFWWFFLFILLAGIGIGIVGGILTGILGETIGLILIIGAMLALYVPYFAVSARRLHDIGKSGWWQLISLVPFVGLVLIYFLVQSSQAGDNQFGPPVA
jgi:uncharacterized membrane protein YhaH (DUF805 family)